MRQAAQEALERVLGQRFPELRSLKRNDGGPPNMLAATAELQGRRVAIGAVLSRGASIDRIQGALARLHLELLATAGPEISLCLVVDDTVGKGVVNKVEQFAHRCMPGASWGIHGAKHRVLESPPLQIAINEEASRPLQTTETAERSRSRIYSDVNRWLLKLFIDPRLREGLAMQDEDAWPPKDPMELSRWSGVAYETARKFVVAFEERSFIIRKPGPLRLRHVEDLLRNWLEDERTWSHKELPVRHLTGRAPKIEKLKKVPWHHAIGGFDAARHHRIQHATNASPPLIHVDVEPSRAAERWGLIGCTMDMAHFVLRRPAHPISVFRSCMTRDDGPHYVDTWQIALDVVRMRPRGAEQAEFILQHIAGSLES